MLKTYELSSFDGGLVTSVDESLLAPNMSPALCNVDFALTGAITRRKGYVAEPISGLGAGDVRGMTRLYKTDGTNFWMVAIGGTVYSTQVVSGGSHPSGDKEYITSGVTGTSTQRYLSSYSGGSAVYAEQAITATLPYCNKATLYFGSRVTASLVVDTAATVSLTATSYHVVTGLAATEHSFTLIPATMAASTAAHLETATPSTSNWSRTALFMTATSMPDPCYQMQVDFYDDATTVQSEVYAHLGKWSIGALPSVSATYYALTHDDGWSVATSVPRSTGWHTVANIIGAPYIDGANVAPTGRYSRSKNITYAALVVRAYANHSRRSAYFDRMIVGDELFDAFEGADISATNWRKGYAGGTGVCSISATHYSTGIYPLTLDHAIYSTTASLTATALTLSASSDIVAMATIKDTVAISTAYNDVIYYDGVTATAIPTGPSAGFLVEHKDRLFASGGHDDPSLLEVTGLSASASTWDWSSTNGFADHPASKDAGAKCTGLAVFDNRVFWFAPSQVHSYNTSGTTTSWIHTVHSQTIGCIAPRSIAVGPRDVFFLSAQGVMSYGVISGVNTSDGAGFSLLSREINATLMGYTESERIDAVGAFYENKYWLAIGGDVYVMDFGKRTKAGQPPWSKYEFGGPLSSGGITTLYVSRGDEIGLFAGSDGAVYRLETGDTDGGDPISISYSTPPIAIGGFPSVKHFRRVYLRADSDTTQALTVTPESDDVACDAVNVDINATTAIHPLRIPLNARGRSLKLTFSSDGTNQPISISSVGITYVPPRVR